MLIDARAQSSETLILDAGGTFIRLDKLTTAVSWILSFLFSLFIQRISCWRRKTVVRLELKPTVYLG